jgi:hypothetical protein
MEERRSSTRRLTVLKGQVFLNNGASFVDCSVRNLSGSGARIQFADTFVPPREFMFKIPSKDLLFQARVVWSRGMAHGVTFTQRLVATPVRQRARAEFW